MAFPDFTKDFKPVSAEEWLEKIRQDLKDGDPSRLEATSREGLRIKAFYHQQQVDLFPQPFRQKTQWHSLVALEPGDENEVNQLALRHLKGGASALLFYLHGHEDLNRLLREVQLEHIRTEWVVEEPEKFLEGLQAMISERNLDPARLQGSFNWDPIENRLRTGQWWQSAEKDMARHKALQDMVPSGFAHSVINANLPAHAGADLAQQMGTALAAAYEYFYRQGRKDLARFAVIFALGSDFFGEIARLRAFRQLWRQLGEELQVKAPQPVLLAESSLRNKSRLDAHNNMIRATCEAMAGVIGGADVIWPMPYDALHGQPSDRGQRVALNHSHILQYEAHLDAVRDVAGGSWYVEELSHQLAAGGWQFFKEIEARGGLIEALEAGWLQEQIAAAAQVEQEAYQSGNKTLVGVNRYPSARDEFPLPQSSETSDRKDHSQILPVRRLARPFEEERAHKAQNG